MKKLLFLLFLPLSLFAQTPDATIKTNTNNLIRNSTNVTRANHSLINDQITDSKESRIQPFIAAGTNTYTVTIPYVTSYLFGLTVPVQFLNANSGASTINITGSSGSPLGAKSLKKSVIIDLATGDILANESKVLWYDGTNFQVRNIAGSGGGGGISGLTSGRVTFATSATTIGDSPDLTWDNTNKVLDIRTGGTARFQRSDNALYWELGIPSGTSDITFSNSINVGFQFNTGGTTRWGYTNTQQFFIGTHLNFAANSYVFGGTTITAGSVLVDFQSSTKGIVLPTATRASITTPVNAMLTVDTNVPYFHNGTSWRKILNGTVSLSSEVSGELPVINGGIGSIGLGSPLQQIRINAGGTAFEYFTPVSGLSLSSLTGGASNNSFDNVSANHTWSWNSLSNTKGFLISSNSQNASVNSQRLFNVELSGANTNSSETTYAASVSNTHTGTSSTNIALNLSASGGTVNRALNIAAGELALAGSAGTSGQVLTSQGANATPIWSSAGGTYYAPTTLVANATDANFTATANGVHNILDGVASTNRVITIPTGANGDVMKFYNTEDTRVWSFTGATVYLADRVTVVTELLYNVPCHMERIDGRWIITN